MTAQKTAARETTCLVATCLFFDCCVKFVLLLKPCCKTCFIVYIVIVVLDSFRKQCIVFLFFALEYEV